MRFKDNSEYQITDNLDKLLKIANCSIYSLKNNQGKSLFIFPSTVMDCKDKYNEQHIFDIYPNKKGYSLKTGNIAGFIGVDNINISIKSRFSNDGDSDDFFLYYMLQKVLAINVLDLKHSTFEEQVFDLQLYLFSYYLNDAVSQGLYKEYQQNKYNDFKIKGIIDINRHINKNIPFNGSISYNTREFSYDNNITQLIRHTIEYIKTKEIGKAILSHSFETQTSVSMIISATSKYQKLDRQKVINSNLKPVHHPYFTKYAALQNICLTILQREQFKYSQNKNSVYGVLFDVAWLWEEYLSTLLIKHGFTHTDNREGKFGFYLAYNSNNKKGKFLRYPDFFEKDIKKCVIDAKYKKNIDAISDVNQLITYIHCLKSKVGIFIQPTVEMDENKKYMLNGYAAVNNASIQYYKFYVKGKSTSFDEFKMEMLESEKRLSDFILNIS